MWLGFGPQVTPLRSHARSGAETAGIHRIDLHLSARGYARLRAGPREKVWAICDVQNGGPIKSLLHLKGSGSFEGIDGRPNFTIHLVGKTSGWLTNYRSFYLHNNNQDPTAMRDMIARWVYHDMGVPVPTISHAYVFLNGKNLGLYTLCERVRGEFLRREFGSKKGQLFEGEHRDSSFTFEMKAAEPSASNPQMPRRSTQLISALNTNAYDLRNLRAFVAAEYLTAHGDGFLNDLNNYWIYSDPSNSKLSALPHTLDYSFRPRESALNLRPRPQIFKDMFDSKIERGNVYASIKAFVARGRIDSFWEYVRGKQDFLLSGIVQQEPERAVKRCYEFEKLNTVISNHFAQIMTGIDITEGFAQCKGFFYDPAQIQFRNCGNYEISRGTLLTIKPKIGEYTRSGKTAKASIPLIVGPGEYLVSLLAKSNPKGSRREKAGIVCVVSSDKVFRRKFLIGSVWRRMEISFMAPDISKWQPFDARLLALDIEIEDDEGDLVLDLGACRITPILPRVSAGME